MKALKLDEMYKIWMEAVKKKHQLHGSIRTTRCKRKAALREHVHMLEWMKPLRLPLKSDTRQRKSFKVQLNVSSAGRILHASPLTLKYLSLKALN